jgi:peptidoglycan/LPS O-acetylase OafA/YrhL
MRHKNLTPEEKWIVKGIPVLFIIGGLWHMLYDLSGKSFTIGLIAAVNESVWEHSKMILLPVICWWSIYYIIKRKANGVDSKKWFTGAIASLLCALILIPMIYYFYTGVFGTELLAVDICILFFSIMIGQMLGLFIYRHAKGLPLYIPILVFGILVAVFVIATLLPPQIPLFRDGLTGSYGIKH